MKIQNLAVGIMLIIGSLLVAPIEPVVAADCPDVSIVFARGSGGERWTDQNYLAFKKALNEKLAGSGIDYSFVDLDYPAVGISNPLTLIGAYVGGGEAYEFGKSVNEGVSMLTELVNHTCPNTKYVVAGYSQGAMVVSKSLRQLDAKKVIYAATFGDPKLFLPEGFGIMPEACTGGNLSDYRMYVPDCRAYIGKLGTYTPYRPSDFVGKYGTWCNKMDVFCSSYLSIDDHTSYVGDNLYEDASKVIYDKIADAFSLEKKNFAVHNTVIMIDSTKSMQPLIDQYKAEALRLTKLTLDGGGKVALYDFKDLSEEYGPIKHCDFETCTYERVRAELNLLEAKNLWHNSDWPESVLSSAHKIMQWVDWDEGATKSIVVLTDANYHNPDRDGTTYEQVVRLSREIDPVNFYVVTTEEAAPYYEDLTQDTDGMIGILGTSEIEITDRIISRYDALPKVMEWMDDGSILPEVTVANVTDYGEAVTVEFRSDSGKVMVALNDAFVGVKEGSSVTLTGLDRNVKNTVTLVPINETRSGAPVNVGIDAHVAEETQIVVPLAPDTGRL